jgi:hypothetical protein
VALTRLLKVPAAQATHATKEGSSPASVRVHACPGSHRHEYTEVWLRAYEKACSGHAAHAWSPRSTLKVLGAQPAQSASPSGPPPASKPAAHTRSQEPSPAATYSASHAHMLALREPAGAPECGVHGAHAAFAVAFL